MGSRAARKKRSKSKRHRRIRRSWIFSFGLVAVVAAAGYVAWLDHLVRERFEGQRWELPARVYAQPLELYPGARISAAEIEDELRLLGYRQVRQTSGPGEFAAARDRVNLWTRGFRFWDGADPPKRLRLRFEDGRISAMRDLRTGRAAVLARLEPMEIGQIYPRDNEDRVLVRLKDVPPLFIHTLLAVEDRGFYQHFGIDPKAIARALLADLRAGRITQGGSTLTQQLAKNLFLDRERSLWRKANEALMALLLEYHYSKNEILETYINEIFLGQDGRRAIHGFGLASRFYFGKPLKELEPHEIALLVGMVRGASYYDPRRHPQRALKRRNVVLQVMADQGVISQAAARAEMQAPLGVNVRQRFASSRFPAFMDLVRRQLRRNYRDKDLRSEGLQIFTTLDPRLQLEAERSLSGGLQRLERHRHLGSHKLEGAVVVTSADGGEVLAMVGGRDVRYAGFNRALDARRPIGSLVKPAVYLTALSRPKQYSVVSTLEDEPVSWKDAKGDVWTPHNYDRRVHGDVPLYEALAHSYNLATVRLGMRVGVKPVREVLRALGIDHAVPALPSLFLGAVDLSPMDVAQMYQTLASGGFRVPLRAIREVHTRSGKPLHRYALTIQQAFEPGPVYLVKYLLTDVVREGTARQVAERLPQSMPLAGKTGTTNDLRDSWFAGFGSNLLAVVWVGRDDNRPAGLTGASGALQIWETLMEQAKPKPVDMNPPPNVKWVWVDHAGKRTDASCPGAQRYPFMAGDAPAAYAPCSGKGRGAEGLFETIRGWFH